jgi:flagellar basal body rod protein FlgG
VTAALGAVEINACGTGVASQGCVNVSLYQAAAALNANSKWQEVISQNLASSSIPGYKNQTVSFDAVQSGYLEAAKSKSKVGLPNATVHTSFSSGEMRYTGGKTDVAIDGKGFFEVKLANGSTAYTRDGEFHINAQGQLVTKAGYEVAVSGGANFDRNDASPITISSTGQISQGAVKKGTIQIAEFNDPTLLTGIGGGLFIANNANLTPSTPAQVSVKQGFLEAANTSTASEMSNLISVMRSYEANQKTIQLNDERMSRSISELGNPS